MNYIANISRNEGDPRILSSGPSSLTTSDRMARCLGWFSIALGAVELVAPRAVTRFLGMEGRDNLLRAFGAREISAGIVSLSTEKQVGMWSRVLGDVMDLAALVGAYRLDNPKRSDVGLAIGMVIGITMLDIAAGQMTPAYMHANGTSGAATVVAADFRVAYRRRAALPEHPTAVAKIRDVAGGVRIA